MLLSLSWHLKSEVFPQCADFLVNFDLPYEGETASISQTVPSPYFGSLGSRFNTKKKGSLVVKIILSRRCLARNSGQADWMCKQEVLL